MPEDVIYNDTGQAYHCSQHLTTMAHIWGSHTDNTLMARLQHELQTMPYFSALDPSPLPVHLQKRGAQLLLEQLPLLDRMARWYSREDIDIHPKYTICLCHLQQPETWDHIKRCSLAQEGVHLATWKPEGTMAQHAAWGPGTPLPNEVQRLMRQPEIKGAVLRGAVPLGLYRVGADDAPNTKATLSHMQPSAIKPAEAQLQRCVEWYAQAAQHAPSDQLTYYNLLIHYQSVQPTD